VGFRLFWHEKNFSTLHFWGPRGLGKWGPVIACLLNKKLKFRLGACGGPQNSTPSFLQLFAKTHPWAPRSPGKVQERSWNFKGSQQSLTGVSEFFMKVFYSQKMHVYLISSFWNGKTHHRQPKTLGGDKFLLNPIFPGLSLGSDRMVSKSCSPTEKKN
jgi:hypothetical protein